MSIRMLAVELYRVISEIKQLEKKIETLKPDSPRREELERELRKAEAEKARLKKMLEGAKD